MTQILLVDDDEPFREMLRVKLGKMGYAVIVARDGKEALRLCETTPPELVLTDLIMPEADGLEIIGELRRSRPGLKVVAMSGGGRINAIDYLKIAQKMGAVRTLNKPFSDDELTAAIEAALALG